MLVIKSLLEWWRLIGSTIAGLPFLIWSNKIGLFLKELSNQSLSILVGALLIGFIISFIYLLKFKSKLSDKLILKYGFFWDKKKNSYCPVCQKPVSYNKSWSNGSGGTNSGYFCSNCKHIYPLSDERGKELTPESVLAKL